MRMWWEVLSAVLSAGAASAFDIVERILTELILGTMVTMIISMTVSVCTWQAESVTCVS